MTPDLEGIVIIVGNYGSGKTEVAINLAAVRSRDGIGVQLADLDLVNPYFRTREAREPLRGLGIELVIPPEAYLHADLPILSPEVAAMIRRPSRLTILDVGGDHVGANVLGALADAFGERPVHMLQVINPFRPFTGTVTGCQRVRREIEAAAKRPITGIVGNANLIDQTTAAHVYEGAAFVRDVCEAGDLPLVFVTAPVHLVDDMDMSRIDCPVLPIQRQLVPPWRQAAEL